MGTHRLIAHPDHPPAAVEGVVAQLTVASDNQLLLRFRIDGHEALVIPPFAGLGRADELWRTTCFELYVQGADTAYFEFNFSPSRRWAAYSFTDYREGMRDLPMGHEPVCEFAEGERFFVMDVRLSAATLPPQPWTVGLSAIIEEEGGVKSYWALAHAPGKPDFHHPACVALTIEPTDPA